MKYGIRLKKYGRMMKGYHTDKAKAEAFAKKLESQGHKTEIVALGTSKSKLNKVI